MGWRVQSRVGMQHEEQYEQEAQLPLESPGVRLRNARQSSGLSLAEMADRTKISERQLTAIEEDDFESLAGKTYAIGFSRTYAKALGVDDAEIIEGVRAQLAEREPYRPTVSNDFEPGDPARVPPSRLAWIAGLGVVAVLAVLFFAWPGFLSPAGTMPSLLEPAAPEKTSVAKAAPVKSQVPSAGPVVFTSLEDDIWVKFYDASGAQLMQKQMNEGETYTVPADADGPQVWTGRADAFRVTVGGREIPRFADVPTTIRDFPVSAQALAERGDADASDATAPDQL